MTFKHIKFEDSSTMRSLVKVAQNNGWIKEETINKTASKSDKDLNPTLDLTVNLLKLCEGLRISGFAKQADEIENNFLSYKKAQSSLYGVTSETGEDLVQSAHPKGSYRMKDLDSKEAVFEDLLDKHIQFMNVVNSKPTGKLASSKDVINAVGNILKFAADDLDNLYAQAKVALLKFRQIYGNLNLQMGDDTNSNDVYFNVLQKQLDKRAIYDNLDLEGALSNTLNYWKNDHEPGFFSSGTENQKWKDVIVPMISIANRFAEQFRSAVANIRNLETAAKTQSVQKQYDPDVIPEHQIPEISIQASPLTNLFKQVNDLKSKIQSWLAVRSITQNANASKWIQDEISALTDISKRYSKVSEDQAANMIEPMKQEIEKEIKDINTFQNLWLRSKV